MAVGLNFSRRPFRDTRPITLTIAACALLGLILLAANVRDFLDFRARAAGTVAEIEKLNADTAAAQRESGQHRASIATLHLKELRIESEQLNKILRERSFSWLLLLSRLEKALPDEVFLTHLDPQIAADGSALLTLSCVGKNGSSIVKTLSILSKNPHFSQPIPMSESDPEKGAPEGFRFHLQVHYTPGGGPS